MKDIIIPCFMCLIPLVAICLAAFLLYNGIGGWWAFLLIPLFTSIKHTPDKVEKQ